MFKPSDFDKEWYFVGEASKYMGISIATLRNYDRDGIIHCVRLSRNRRALSREELICYLVERGLCSSEDPDQRRDAVYCRVSTAEQRKKGDLDRQVYWIIQHAPDIHNPLIFSEVASGLNDRRKKLLELLARIEADEIRYVYITYKDRLTRFGYHYLEEMARAHKTEIIPLKTKNSVSSEDELVQDMMSLIASFSGKLYGMRSRQSRRKKDTDEQRTEENLG